MGTVQGGLWMLLALGLLVMGTGLPVWALLLGVSSAAAAFGWGLGVLDVGVLTALPARLTGLLESDLLQALPLYVFVGVLLQRVALADALYAGASRGLARWGAGPAGGVLGVGLLVAPMNGSVASSSSLLARLVWPTLARTPLRRPERA
uniref:TRAP transporter large permease subunit n=1 Tax=Ideonella sp. B508-1 TaxID=137716 RepID=UPI00058C89FB